MIRNISNQIFYNPSLISRSLAALKFHSNTTSASNINQEVDSALEIEVNLFENSLHKHNPSQVAIALKNNISDHVKNSAIPQKSIKEPKTITDPELGFTFARLQKNDSILTKLLTFIRSRKRRDKERQIIVEGRRFILEALNCGLQMRTLFFSSFEELLLIKERISTVQKEDDTKIYKIAHHDLKTWSTLSTPPGLLGIFDRPPSKVNEDHARSDMLPITVICDNIREPNNLGSIIRTSAAIPCYQVIVTKGCCDPWDTKALRGGCGGQFRINIRDDVEWQNVSEYIPPESLKDYALFIAESNTEKVRTFLQNKPIKNRFISYSNISHIGPHNVVIIGGETHGVSAEAYRYFNYAQKQGTFLHIPLAKGIESLNVNSALTLILFELRKHTMNFLNNSESQ